MAEEYQFRSATTVWFRAAVLYLRDGEWHDYHSTIAKAAKAVPPGIANRAAEQNRLRASGSAVRVRPVTAEEVIEFGARHLARQSVRNGAVFEIDPLINKGGVPRRVRLRQDYLVRHPGLQIEDD